MTEEERSIIQNIIDHEENIRLSNNNKQTRNTRICVIFEYGAYGIRTRDPHTARVIKRFL